MKYTLLYPEAKHRDEPAPGIVYLDRLMDCSVCRDLTHFASVSLRVGICSDKCAQLEQGLRSSLLAGKEPAAGPHEKAA